MQPKIEKTSKRNTGSVSRDKKRTKTADKKVKRLKLAAKYLTY